MLAAFSIVVIVLAVVWAARRPLSEAVVAQWFAGQQVEARYRIAAISPGGVTLADVALGPMASPDFAAERIDATIGWSPLSPRVDTITILRPKLRATLGRSGLSLGSLDRLLPAPGQPAKPLPDIDVRIVGAVVQVATPAGALNGTLEGNGRLRNGFAGHGRIEPATLALVGCTARLAATSFRVSTSRDAAQIAAEGSAPGVTCADGAADAVHWTVAATLPPKLDRYAATAKLTTARVAGFGYRSGAASLTLGAAAAALNGPVAGPIAASIAGVQGQQFGARTASVAGHYKFVPGSSSASGDGVVTVDGGSARFGTAALRRSARSFAGTLVEPLLEALVARGDAAARSFDATARVTVSADAAGQRGTVSGLGLRSASGLKLDQTGEISLVRSVAVPGLGVTLAGGATLAGGGLPRITVAGSGPLRSGRASLTIAPWAVGGAAVQRLRLDLNSDPAGTTVAADVRASGAVGGGVVTRGLGGATVVRLGADGSVVFGTLCMAVDWAGLSRAALRTGPGAARICPNGGAIATLSGGRLSGGAVVDPLNLRGVSGDVPVALATGTLRIALGGTGKHPTAVLAPVRVEGRYGARGGSGTIGGSLDLAGLRGSGRVESVRLDDPGLAVAIGSASARWQLAGGRLSLSGGEARVTDRTLPARFEPIHIAAVSATIADGLVKAHGDGRLAAGGKRLFGFTATHALASGRGEAKVETGTLTFGPDLQPFQLTEALRGVVDNVRGPVIGSGRFDWTADMLTSGGTVRVDHVSLATASLGPVDDVAGTLAFDDLLAMTTPPGQTLTIKRINPGVAVDDGVVFFRMLGPDAAAIESLRWPYAGGALTLAPVTIRAGDLRRDFLLTVDGLDAQLFLQKFEIKDVNVTGIFDGRLPLVFADGHGRIAAGTLVARAGGGLVQYVGAVGGEDLGAGARLAFDALRRLRYKSLTLDLDGDLDGELVTQLRFTGTNEAQTTLGGGPLPIKATGLPFKFNVTVRAPFRALLGTAASFSDVRPLIRPGATPQDQGGVQPR
ncbi:YdbH domain-containing protein [Sphingosinicellaceae bacterium]|nr:YdbH domain-containing protein [Sphingosinicellaceae bacterium]